tara:strand:+ start:167 stop:376 length:210 start_codon:yes stop_codon:yes gene_type:complete
MRSEQIYRTRSNIQTTMSIKEKHEEAYRNIKKNLRRNNISQGVFFVNTWEENFEGLPQSEIDARLRSMR